MTVSQTVDRRWLTVDHRPPSREPPPPPSQQRSTAGQPRSTVTVIRQSDLMKIKVDCRANGRPFRAL
ncbi:unnamed protein product [Cuscuta campestris]|uniref:Uncharacterized protein n=1 Tax=Cuscuta campestris TaxID=132261 RepID=A0A484LLA9_9ASTE|nr:unnamed protein product [Cuscuta campestris]